MYQFARTESSDNRFRVHSDRVRFPNSLKRVFQITDKDGLTMLVYYRLIEKIGDFDGEIRISNGAISVDGRSMFELLQLAAIPGTALSVELRGRDSHRVMKRIESVFANRQ